jgi:hypothetical protein
MSVIHCHVLPNIANICPLDLTQLDACPYLENFSGPDSRVQSVWKNLQHGGKSKNVT